MRRILPLFLLIAFVLLAAVPARTGALTDPATHLTYMTEQYWPMNYTRDGRLTGLAVELLRRMWREMGVPEQPIQLFPWPRAYDMGHVDPRTVLFSMYRTKGRDPDFKWVGPIVRGKTEVFTLRSRHLGARSLRDLAGWRLTAVREVASANILRDAGLPYTGSGSPDTAIKMLTRDRVDAVAMDAMQFHHFAARLGCPTGEFKPVMTLCTDPLYFAFSRDTPDALIRRFQRALDAVTHRPGYRTLLDKYLN
ncbi:Bacterial extracellular solute-binding protein, family 3 [Pseudodesulfovibrio hydrargyri]|uniref:Bacterial extracellular solute-binding protein, family 3 n=2 Tax=Pseudodesulfovibrio hydrargyri TaxID=2125990 RepID=A0A1J5N3C2_9BACT|nr:transporter substrate-binding domain-containing protein [Pseudodesulfovibrio hydrargyri]OIQ49320.1 Bacterial extracellular solute-binding protein, family 3 [Pseudodesulfovibrio hydrargyri]